MIGLSITERAGLEAAYTWSDAIWTIALTLLLIVWAVGGIWLLIALFRNRYAPKWLKGLLLVATVFIPPAGVAAAFSAWVVTRSHRRAAEADRELAEFRAWKAEHETAVERSPEAPPVAPDETPDAPARRLPFPPRPGSAAAPASGSDER
jgi:hypothetical protein